jgi:hypothetical protein
MMSRRGGLLPPGPMSRVRSHDDTIVWAVPGLGVSLTSCAMARRRRQSMIETARNAVPRPNGAGVRVP